jgi:hypothetical protein
MAYFSNGTEGMMYQERYCSKCRNYINGGCAIWDAHLFYAYEECNNDGRTSRDGERTYPKTNAKSILDMLIPIDKETHFAAKCSMFLEMTPEEVAKRNAEWEAENCPEPPLTVMPAMAEWAKARGLRIA